MNHLLVRYVGEEERFTLIHFLREEYKIICNKIDNDESNLKTILN